MTTGNDVPCEDCGSWRHRDCWRLDVQKDDTMRNMGRKIPPFADLDSTATDPVNHPTHYTSGGIETIDAIEAWELNFNTGNAVKYLSRAGKKDPTKTIEDLRKSVWYIQREISRLEKLGQK